MLRHTRIASFVNIIVSDIPYWYSYLPFDVGYLMQYRLDAREVKVLISGTTARFSLLNSTCTESPTQPALGPIRVG